MRMMHDCTCILYIHACIDTWMDRQMDVWMDDGWMYGWMDRQMDGWIGTSLYLVKRSLTACSLAPINLFNNSGPYTQLINY